MAGVMKTLAAFNNNWILNAISFTYIIKQSYYWSQINENNNVDNEAISTKYEVSDKIGDRHIKTDDILWSKSKNKVTIITTLLFMFSYLYSQ